MWIVAVRATHEAFVHTVFEGHRKLSADRAVTAIAEIRLLFCEQELWNRRLVYGMTVGTDYIRGRMGTAPDVASGKFFSMAPQAFIDNLLRSGFRERENRGFAAASLNVRLAGAVTTLAAGLLRRRAAECDRFVVWVLVEVEPDIRMAGLADRAAKVSGR
jgi:hypothetical protein